MVINEKNLMSERIDSVISKFELDHLRKIKAKHLSFGNTKPLPSSPIPSIYLSINLSIYLPTEITDNAEAVTKL